MSLADIAQLQQEYLSSLMGRGGQDNWSNQLKSNTSEVLDDKHMAIYEVIHGLYSSGITATPSAIVTGLDAEDMIVRAGGVSYVLQSLSRVSSESSCRDCASAIVRMRGTAKTVTAARTVIDKARGGEGAVEAAGEVLEAAKEVESGPRNPATWVDGKSGADDVIKQVEESIGRGGQPRGVLTGFPKTDRMLSGLEPGRLYLLAARTGIGKSSFAQSLIENISVRGRRPTIMFSLEMAASEMYLRVMSSVCGVDASNISRGIATHSDLELITANRFMFDKAKMVVDDAQGLTVNQIIQRAKAYANTCDVNPVVIVDYIQIVSPESADIETREREVARIAQQLKRGSRRLNLPFVCLAQLHRRSDDKVEPGLRDLRESGSLEQEADVVGLIHRPVEPSGERMDGERAIETGKRVLIIAKNRSGPCGRIDFKFTPQLTRFDEIGQDSF